MNVSDRKLTYEINSFYYISGSKADNNNVLLVRRQNTPHIVKPYFSSHPQEGGSHVDNFLQFASLLRD